ncbi:uncharacterized protein LOC142361505 [Opisthocomus hoazin]|uniref:uncharacterized protein LOC142361505 n=1 Tax=Opisthocomus hoazin TaxID=30419 RepID=UPI003F52D074
MTSSNLAICLGPNLLSPASRVLLPLRAVLEATAKVNVLVEFMIENCHVICEEETAGLSCPLAKESPAPTDRSTDLHLEEKSGPAGRAHDDQQAKAILHAAPSLLDVLQEAGADTAAESEMAEAPPALPPTTPQSAAQSQVRPEPLTSFPEERRCAGSPQNSKCRRTRKRKEAWGDDRESPPPTKRRKRENVWGRRKLRKYRKLQQAKKPRCRFPVSA